MYATSGIQIPTVVFDLKYFLRLDACPMAMGHRSPGIWLVSQDPIQA